MGAFASCGPDRDSKQQREVQLGARFHTPRPFWAPSKLSHAAPCSKSADESVFVLASQFGAALAFLSDTLMVP